MNIIISTLAKSVTTLQLHIIITCRNILIIYIQIYMSLEMLFFDFLDNSQQSVIDIVTMNVYGTIVYFSKKILVLKVLNSLTAFIFLF